MGPKVETLRLRKARALANGRYRAPALSNRILPTAPVKFFAPYDTN